MDLSLRRIRQGRPYRLAARHGKRAVQRVTGGGRSPRQRRVFVAGVQRSGTNMLMQALERSLQTDVYHESDPRAFEGYEMHPPAVIDGLVRRSPAQLFVIKALSELQDLPELMERFAPAQTVWIYRDFHDVANSMTASFRTVPDTVRRVAEEGEAAGWWGRGIAPETQEFLRRIMAQGPNAHSSAALMWYLRNRLFFDLGLDRDARVLLIRYEELVQEPEAILKKVTDFLGMPYRRRLAKGIHAASVGRRPMPELDPEVEAACQGLMQAFEASRNRRPGTKEA